MEEIEERFKQGNDSLASYWVRKAADDIYTAYLHSKNQDLIDIAAKLLGIAERYERSGN